MIEVLPVPQVLETLTAGDDFVLTLAFADASGNAQDVSGATDAQFDLHRWRGSAAPVPSQSYSLGQGIELTAPEIGELTVTMGAETEGLPDGTYWVNCYLTMADAKRRTAAPFLLRIVQTPRE